MSFLVNAVEQQLRYSLYAPEQSSENKTRIATNCERIKSVAAVVAFATPAFAFFFPAIFTGIFAFATALVAYDLFNIADNLRDAARHSAQGMKPTIEASQTEMLLDNTLLSTLIYKRMIA